MERLNIYTFGKITLFLDVINKREDGYHNIKILLHNINLWDFMQISPLPYPKFIINSNLNIPLEENLVYKAYKKFIETTGRKIGVRIFLYKKIPIQAGLGGGSSNAAGIIWGLNILTKSNLSLKEMANIGETLGSDVPFFFYGGSCVAEGKGELITKILHQSFKFLLILPPYGISTRDIYSKIKKEDLGTHIDFEEIISNFEKGFLSKPYNFFEKIVFEEYQELREIKELISEITPYVAMTGTGSTMFVLIRDDSEIKKINKKIKEYLDKGYKIRSVKSSPLGIKILR
ncbi:MAG: 4-(cytidine 5'-diphospho)-2-C-methyl-D-erythritol kinase [Dictyoglomus thermophilum]|uniref:4-diphosphocytidyl-2-C-methyl-D-erythritol kinase n=1 Tax=Dictyoglomus thermophilum TaxID=14 RepID=A0A7V3ZI37_DICTH|nr:4-(cytidine 5'-diphospho)-2-C-methyl-D-erythritol kinase [Dictyoglomus thermophilum]MCX7719881.1 4-(cytidine 5'-diphospho)-2-C-methyl-D-erythritol kinase [Dictyoglomus thermophilum]TYT22668.1 4-(cytidine 5'-diphospho)-2-C-methyl-D-erythritol kinase [Dictyoglomus thermophilum]